MKDVFSAFGTEIFRPLVTLAFPGALAITPYFIALMQRWASFYQMVNANHTEAAFLLLLWSLFCGLVIEDMGTRIEVLIFDRQAKKRMKDFEVVWWAYMRHEFTVEPPGRRYLRTLVIRLKFELGTAVAALVSVFSWFLVDLPYKPAHYWIALSAVLLVAYMLYESYTTHSVLADLRAQHEDRFQRCERLTFAH